MIGEPAIRFNDPVVFSICLALWDTDGDGYISEAEAKAVKRINQNTFNNRDDITSLDDLDKLEGYIYHAGSFGYMSNLVTASTGNKISLTTNLPDTSTVYYGDNPKLERIKIHPNITEISNGTFTNDVSLKTVMFGGNEKRLGNQCFFKCSSLRNIVLPDSVTEIGYNAFRNCVSLSSINLGNIKKLGGAVFTDCGSLSIDINMPNLEGEISQDFSSSGIVSASNLGKITSITYFAFGSCPNLVFVVLPETLTSIGNATFYSTTRLEYIICHATTPPTLDASAFNGTSCLIYVPDASVDAYKSATNWSKLATRIKPLSEKQ